MTIAHRQIILFAAALLCGAAPAAPAPPPAELVRLLARARLDGPVSAWCAGVFEPGRPRAYAIAVPSSTGGGQYLVLGMGESPVVLATFTGGADLACYSPARAKGLDRSIRASATVHGRIAPKWNTTVVCGFVENTSAVCWQHSPAARAFVKVGEWIT